MAKRRSSTGELKVAFQLGPRPAGARIEIETGRRMRAVAMELSELLRNRLAWTGGTADSSLSRRMCDRLRSLGMSEQDLERISRSRICEVCVPYHSEERGWEARVMPWEFLLNEGTRMLRGSRSTTVVRHLERRSNAAARGLQAIKSVSVVTSSPGAVGDFYSFDRERRLPERYLDNAQVQYIDNPVWCPGAQDQTGELATSLLAQKSEIVHIAGVDNWQGAELLGSTLLAESEGTALLDGMVLADESGRPTAVPAFQIAKAIGSARPYLVNFNIYNSAARTAALTVALGAGAAIGFQDRVDDSWAELFWNDFYRALRAADRPKVAVAFVAAVSLLRRRRGTLRGTGLVLWTATPVQSAKVDVSRAAAALADELDPRTAWAASTGRGDGEPEKSTFEFEIEPLTDLNYSLLHNQRPLFKTFRILPGNNSLATQIHIEVQLHIGPMAQSYRETRIIGGPDDLRDQIFIPLTWITDHSFWESVRTSLLVRISTAGEILYERSHEIAIRPADEWVDTDEDRQWLSSFVYPRDPAVHRVISSAETFLAGILDSTVAGFDGYQSIIPLEEDAVPAGDSGEDEDLTDAEEAYEPIEDTSGVDRQVQAIWSALVKEIKLRYTNPPPTYKADSQRLRTPSAVLHECRGTCIDLTLLLASCLEYVEIYPVVFLLQGHAFPGYWRSDAAHDRFVRRARFGLDDEEDDSDVLLVPDVSDTDLQRSSIFPNYGWLLEGADGYEAVMREIHDGNLVPIESVFMTMSAGLEEAVEEGWENLRNEDEFHSMIDIRQARLLEVTPLPIRENSDGPD